MIKVSPMGIITDNSCISNGDLAFYGLKGLNLKDLDFLEDLTFISTPKHQIRAFYDEKGTYTTNPINLLNINQNKHINTLIKINELKIINNNLIKIEVNKDRCLNIFNISIIGIENPTGLR